VYGQKRKHSSNSAQEMKAQEMEHQEMKHQEMKPQAPHSLQRNESPPLPPPHALLRTPICTAHSVEKRRLGGSKLQRHSLRYANGLVEPIG
jgi:hypothetical protein